MKRFFKPKLINIIPSLRSFSYTKSNLKFNHTKEIQNDLELILDKYNGIFDISLKLQIKDKTGLSWAYSPGVGASCLEIQKSPDQIYNLTNIYNSMVVLTDSSAIGNPKWNNYAAIPYLEIISVYNKKACNIDCYPLVLDLNMINSSEDLAFVINRLRHSFSGVECWGIDDARYNEMVGLLDKDSSCFILSSDRRTEIDNRLKAEHVIGLSSNFIYAACARTALFCQYYTEITPLIDFAMDYVAHMKNIFNSTNYDYYEKMESLICYLTKKLLHQGKLKDYKKELSLINSELTVDKVKDLFQMYVNEGKKAWIKPIPESYNLNEHSLDENATLLHDRYRGMVETDCKLDFKNTSLLEKLFHIDNVRAVSEKIMRDPDMAYKLTCKSNLSAIITNGTAVLGFGDIGAKSALPVMEGKSALFKIFGGTNVIPFIVQEKDAEKFIKFVKMIWPIFSCINLEDIKSPECFYIEKQLDDVIPYPVFHDDQHGTAIVALAAIINALKLAKKKIGDVKIVMNGAGAAGLSVTSLLMEYGAKDFIVCDRTGALYEGRQENMNKNKMLLATRTNKNLQKGSLAEVIKGADIFIGLSEANTLTKDMVKSMAKDPIIFALANPIPEIMPKDAYEAGALVVGTGRSDLPNQINNSLAFPGIFRAVIDTKSTNITLRMKIAAAEGIASLINDDEVTRDMIIPNSLDLRVPISVARAVAEEAIKEGVTKISVEDISKVEQNILCWNVEGQLKNLN